jgi:hypothetical protein
MRWLAVVLLLVACGKHHNAGKVDEKAAKELFDVVELKGAPPGISDLTADDKGTLWAIAERERVVIEIAPDGSFKRHPIEGVEDGLDTEGLVWLGNGQFGLGLEATHKPIAAVAFADLDGDKLVVHDINKLGSYGLGVEITSNHGIESVCGTKDELIAVTESVITQSDGARDAVLVRVRPGETQMSNLRLTTTKGKISALYCTVDADGNLEALAIERHYGVERLLHFAAKRSDRQITPELVLDLAPILHDSLNLEGITKLPDGRMVLVNDNQGDEVKGPTELLYFHPR